jgi:hypothetical protein
MQGAGDNCSNQCSTLPSAIAHFNIFHLVDFSFHLPLDLNSIQSETLCFFWMLSAVSSQRSAKKLN